VDAGTLVGVLVALNQRILNMIMWLKGRPLVCEGDVDAHKGPPSSSTPPASLRMWGRNIESDVDAHKGPHVLIHTARVPTNVKRS
jgi:hypothetical protein